MRSKITALFLGLFASLLAFDGNAFFIGPQPPSSSSVVEYFNTALGHYFYTLNPDEIAAIDTGAAGPGWRKTGLLFFAFPTIEASGNSSFPACDKNPSPCVPVSRFYGTPGLGPNSHFYTANAAEAAGLMQPNTGWTYEETAFVLPVPDAATHQCASGTVPVHRFYNGRFAQNDSNHRYTASDDAAAHMRAAGWLDEGIAFCAYGRGAAQIETHQVDVADTAGLLQAGVCDREVNAGRSCLGFSNLPVPNLTYPVSSVSAAIAAADEFTGRTHIWDMGNPNLTENVALPADSREAAAQDVFVQLSQWRDVFGLHLSTRSKGASPYSSIAPMMRLPTVAAADGDARLFPFAPRYETGYELRLTFGLGLASLSVDPGSAAYGVATIEFQDRASGLRLRSNVLAYGSAAAAEFVGRDAKDGVVIVGTSFRQGSPYGRAVNGEVVTGPARYGAAHMGYAWWVKRDEFMRVIAAARGVEPGLSADPADYFVRSFGVPNEIYGSGDMSLYLFGVQLALAPVFDF